MPNTIEIYEHDGATVRARIHCSRQQLDITLSLAPGADYHALLVSEADRLAPLYDGPYDAARDIPPLDPLVTILENYDGTTWRTS